MTTLLEKDGQPSRSWLVQRLNLQGQAASPSFQLNFVKHRSSYNTDKAYMSVKYNLCKIKTKILLSKPLALLLISPTPILDVGAALARSYYWILILIGY